MDKEGLKKLAAHVDKLLDLYMGAAAHYELLRPIMTDEELIVKLSKDERGIGFETLRHILYWNFINELVKLITDIRSPRTPSVRSIVNRISDSTVKNLLKQKYVAEHQSTWPIDERKKYASQFDEMYSRVMVRVQSLLGSPAMKSYQTIRDKLLAHYEVNPTSGSYELINIAKLGLKYGDERSIFSELQLIISDLNSLIRSASFDFKSFDQRIRTDSRVFWTGVG